MKRDSSFICYGVIIIQLVVMDRHCRPCLSSVSGIFERYEDLYGYNWHQVNLHLAQTRELTHVRSMLIKNRPCRSSPISQCTNCFMMIVKLHKYYRSQMTYLPAAAGYTKYSIHFMRLFAKDWHCHPYLSSDSITCMRQEGFHDFLAHQVSLECGGPSKSRKMRSKVILKRHYCRFSFFQCSDWFMTRAAFQKCDRNQITDAAVAAVHTMSARVDTIRDRHCRLCSSFQRLVLTSGQTIRSMFFQISTDKDRHCRPFYHSYHYTLQFIEALIAVLFLAWIVFRFIGCFAFLVKPKRNLHKANLKELNTYTQKYRVVRGGGLLEGVPSHTNYHSTMQPSCNNLQLIKAELTYNDFKLKMWRANDEVFTVLWKTHDDVTIDIKEQHNGEFRSVPTYGEDGACSIHSVLGRPSIHGTLYLPQARSLAIHYLKALPGVSKQSPKLALCLESIHCSLWDEFVVRFLNGDGTHEASLFWSSLEKIIQI